MIQYLETCGWQNIVNSKCYLVFTNKNNDILTFKRTDARSQWYLYSSTNLHLDMLATLINDYIYEIN